MKDLFVNSVLHNLNDASYDEEKVALIKYGLEAIYLTVTKLIIILIIAFFFNVVIEIILLLVFFGIIRGPSFGMHANTSNACLVLSIALLLIPIIFLHDLTILLPYKIIIAGACLLSFILYAPADTVKRPLINKEKRMKLKKASLLIVVIYITLIFTFADNNLISNTLLYALVLQGLMITPMFYKILKQPYQNYKNYKKEV